MFAVPCHLDVSFTSSWIHPLYFQNCSRIVPAWLPSTKCSVATRRTHQTVFWSGGCATALSTAPLASMKQTRHAREVSYCMCMHACVPIRIYAHIHTVPTIYTVQSCRAVGRNLYIQITFMEEFLRFNYSAWQHTKT